jgi:hypothetical protein
VVGTYGKLHNEELHNVYSPTNIIRVNKPKEWGQDM